MSDEQTVPTEDWWDDSKEWVSCHSCGGDGHHGSACIDDICAYGERVPCMHGDHGVVTCDVCKGEGGYLVALEHLDR